MTEREIFTAALNQADPVERAALLDKHCAGNAPLRQRIESLLAEHQQLGSFMEVPSTDATIDQPTERAGTQIGPYKLLQEIGQGGMGVVYMAEQTEPVTRRVALKIIKPGMDTRQVIARFEAERQALSLMDHPNIAKVLDASTTVNGRPYFVMELVKGQPITEYCDQQHLTPRQRLELFLPVCQAIQHAHQKGIIHRDIKPSNILIAEYDHQAVPKVIDFGVAKATTQRLTQMTMFTGYGQIVGTLEYMSPEQAKVNQLDIDTRSDIYSLGVLLYELLTGTTPFEKQRLRSAAWDEMLRIIREEEPPKPSTKLSESKDALPSISAKRQTEPAQLAKMVRGELDWIVMKALEKDRNRRYETVTSFALDVQRYLADEPVLACPPRVGYQAWKFARRHRATLATATVVATALVTGIVAATGQAWRATRAERRVQEELEQKTAAHARAEANFLQTLAAVDQLLSEVGHKDLASVPHLEPVRRRLLEKALAFFMTFLQQRGDDTAVRFETALAYYRVGEIRRLLGQQPGAEEAFDQAIRLLTTLVAEQPANPAGRRELAHAYASLAMLRHLAGQPEAAWDANQKARALQVELVDQEPQRLDDRRDLANSLNLYGAILKATGQREQARDTFHNAASLLEQVQQEMRRDADACKVHLKCLGNLSNTLGELDNLADAEHAYLNLRKTSLEAAELFADDREIRSLACQAAINYGNFLWNHGRPDDARPVLQDAVARARKLAEDFPFIPAYRQELAGALSSRGLQLWKSGDRDAAREPLEAAIAETRKLSAEFPAMPAYQGHLGGMLSNLACVAEELDQLDEAHRLLQQAIVCQESALQLDPGNTRYREYLRNHVTNMALVLHRLRAPEDELDRAHRRAVDLARTLATERPNVPDDASGAGTALANWANVQIQRKQFASARKLLDEAIEYQQRAIQADPLNPLYRTLSNRHRQALADISDRLDQSDRTSATPE